MLSGDVAQARGEFEEVAADRMAVLADEQDAIALIDRGHSYGTGVQDHVPDGDGSTGKANLVTDHRPDTSGEVLGARQDVVGVRLIA